eukprot:Selendium_serpulae@DN5415_c0_g1_i2.p1
MLPSMAKSAVSLTHPLDKREGASDCLSATTEASSTPSVPSSDTALPPDCGSASPTDADSHTEIANSSGEDSGLASVGALQMASRLRYGDLGTVYDIPVKQVLGTGFNGPVRCGTHRETGKRFAFKTFDLRNASPAKVDLIKNESLIYLKLDHPNIVRLIELWEDETSATLVMELCTGGELYERLSKVELYSEQSARDITLQMTGAIYYLHSHRIVHRDLKLENWLYSTPEADAQIRLIDFGFSRFWSPVESMRMHLACGTLSYVSPDTLKGGYTNACDNWSLGVIVYMLLVGFPPFYGSEAQITDGILSGNYVLKGHRWQKVSSLAKDFVSRLLVVNPERRMTAAEALKHPWLASAASQISAPINAHVVHGMRKFAAASNLKRAALTMMAYSLTSEEIEGMHSAFLAMDTTGDGTIRLSGLASAIRDNHEVSNDEIERIFSAMDNSGDQQIYYNDFLAAMFFTRLKIHEHVIRATFDKFDIDSTGFITLDNLREVLGVDSNSASDLEKMLMEADRDGNGRIDYHEFFDEVLGDNPPGLDDVLFNESRMRDKSFVPNSVKSGPRTRGLRGLTIDRTQSTGGVTSKAAAENRKQQRDQTFRRLMALNMILDKLTSSDAQTERRQGVCARKTPLPPRKVFSALNSST